MHYIKLLFYEFNYLDMFLIKPYRNYLDMFLIKPYRKNKTENIELG